MAIPKVHICSPEGVRLMKTTGCHFLSNNINAILQSSLEVSAYRRLIGKIITAFKPLYSKHEQVFLTNYDMNKFKKT
jgi:hypothetical protein